MKRLFLALLFSILMAGCSQEQHLHTEFLTSACIKPVMGYHYKTCNDIIFVVNRQQFVIPASFDTDLASIPKIAWPFMAPAHSSLIRPAIVHDWLYRKTCDFTRLQTDLIFYHMLRNDGISSTRATIMYYAVRVFGANYYNEDYCDDEFKGLDQEARGFKIATILRHRREANNRMGA